MMDAATLYPLQSGLKVLSAAEVHSSTKAKSIPLIYDRKNPKESAIRLAYAVRPEWETGVGDLEIHQFIGGLMNSLFKITKMILGRSEKDNEKDAILLRVYGLNTDTLVDRELEAIIHAQLAELGLAAPLLARFQNGLLYGFVPGRVYDPKDMTDERTWKAIAAKLGEWHARIQPPVPRGILESGPKMNSGTAQQNHQDLTEIPRQIFSRSPTPNIWTEMQRWVLALPAGTQEQKDRKARLQGELESSFLELDHDGGLGRYGYVVGHNDLLSANIVLPATGAGPKTGYKAANKVDDNDDVLFIDYEYAKACPAAFDLANHFSEWGGFKCDYNMLPNRSVRRAFVEHYIESYSKYVRVDNSQKTRIIEQLISDVDRYRGIPGFRWALHALIEESITEIDFDWAGYAEVRLAEYWAWRNEENGQRASSGQQMPLRERRWAEET